MSNRNSFIRFSVLSILSAASVGLTTVATTPSVAIAQEAAFSQKEIDSNSVVAVASPYGEGEHQLLVIQQIKADKQCWAVTGNEIKTVEPLLAQFDFTGICGRATDSNGYSIRMAGQDLGWRYSLTVVKRDGETLLIGRPTGSKKVAEIMIGRIKGVPNEFAKFDLEPGWRISKRTFNGEELGHFYLTNEQSLASLNQQQVAVVK
jgi:Protein of unknown function (DUF3747)